MDEDHGGIGAASCRTIAGAFENIPGSMRALIPFVAVALLAGCATAPPRNMDNSCAIFEEYRGWYRATKRVQEKYGLPQHIQLAIVHQESRFDATAKTPRRYLLGFIPWGRVSTAYGYAQVKDETWAWYQRESGNWLASRDNFADAVEFIGWYSDISQRTLGISKWDARQQYLAYHEGHGGFKRKTYLQKPWLMDVARKVEARAARYNAQLKTCREKLEGPWWWPF